MAYIPDATDATQPTSDKKAKTAAEEFRAIKAYLNGIVAAGLPSAVGNNGMTLGVNQSGVVNWRANAGNDCYNHANFI